MYVYIKMKKGPSISVIFGTEASYFCFNNIVLDNNKPNKTVFKAWQDVKLTSYLMWKTVNKSYRFRVSTYFICHKV